MSRVAALVLALTLLAGCRVIGGDGGSATPPASPTPDAAATQQEDARRRPTATRPVLTARPAPTATRPVPSPIPSPSPMPTLIPLPTYDPTRPCHALDPATTPDPTCTPGVWNPAVTQATIHQTICVPGWTATVRPPLSYTGPLKRQQMIEYGYGGRQPSEFEEDHYFPLEGGGATTDPRNLWPQLGPSPNPKDGKEGLLRDDICSGRKTLDQAHHDWEQGWQQYR